MTSPTIAPTTTGRRRIYNPVQDDVVTFLVTSEESGGERSLGELDVAPGGRVTPHYHKTYTESFRVRAGQLTLRIGDARLTLGPGEEATVPAGTLHAWSNAGAERAVAHVELRPGQPGFETALRVAYGLATDGRVLRNGMPRNPLHTALLLAWGDGRMPGVYAALEPVFRLLVWIARQAGIDRELEERYR
jgi:mannose-6-phosphate isomerase-like protein (cupin superfamily)